MSDEGEIPCDNHNASDSMDVEDVELPDELVVDEADREMLLQMTMLDREEELSRRKDKQRREQERQKLLEIAEETAEAKGGSSTTRKPSDTRPTAVDEASDEELTFASQTGTPPAAREQPRVPEELGSEKDSEDFDTDNKEAVENEADFSDYLSAQVFRSDLERWISEPHFAKSVLGCFVRFHGGGSDKPDINRNEYIMVEVIDCQTKEDADAYSFGPGKKPTRMQLLLRRGGTEFWTSLDVISNSEFTQKEFQEWVHACKKHRRSLLSKLELDERKEQITQARKFVFTHTEVKKILEVKRKTGSLKMSNVMQRANLMRMRTFYDSQNDVEKVVECDEKIRGLEAKADAQRRHLSTGVVVKQAAAQKNLIKAENLEAWIEKRRPRLLEKFEKKLSRLPVNRRAKAMLDFYGPKHPLCANVRDTDIHLPFLQHPSSPDDNAPIPDGLITDPDLQRDIHHLHRGNAIASGLKRYAEIQSEQNVDSLISNQFLSRWAPGSEKRMKTMSENAE